MWCLLSASIVSFYHSTQMYKLHFLEQKIVSERSGFLTEVVQLIRANLGFVSIFHSGPVALRFSLLCLASQPPAPMSGASTPIGLKEGSGRNWEMSEKPRHFSLSLSGVALSCHRSSFHQVTLSSNSTPSPFSSQYCYFSGCLLSNPITSEYLYSKFI